MSAAQRLRQLVTPSVAEKEPPSTSSAAPSSSSSPSSHRHPLLPMLIFSVLCGIAAALAARSGSHWFVDLRVYVIGGDHALEVDLYDAQDSTSGLPFTYPPAAALLMAPLAHLPFAVAAGVLTAVSTGCLWYLTSVALGGRGQVAGDRSADRPASWWATGPASPVLLSALCVLALLVEPVWATFSFGQINLVITALCVADLACPRRHRGVLTGIAAGLKLTPLFFVAYLLVTRQWRAAARMTLAFAAVAGLGFVVNPHAATTFWTQAVTDSSRVGAAVYAGNQAVSGVLPRWHGAPVADGVRLVICAIIAVLTLVAARLAQRRFGDQVGVLTAAFGMLAVSPISWNHHWVWAWPAFLVIALHVRRDELGWLVATLAWGTVFTSRALWWPPSTHDREFGWNPLQNVAGSLYLAAALSWCVAVAVLARRRQG